MKIQDWASFLTLLMSAIGLFVAWWNRRVLEIELRGVKGYKFRAMWRQYADQHGIPQNGDDAD